MTTKIIGSGLICLDIIYNRNKIEEGVYTIGGSCGNVISILSYLNCSTYPIIPHEKDDLTYQLLEKELYSLNVNDDLILEENNYRVPIIIQENYKQTHKFKFKNPLKSNYLPKYKSLNNKVLEDVKNIEICPDFFYFDRCNLANLELAKYYKEKGAIIFFEPSKVSYEKVFKECLKYSDIVKYSHDRLDNIDSFIEDSVIPVEIKTLGKNGLKFRLNNGLWISQTAKKVKNVIDTSGCGDICSAGLICYLKENKCLSEENIYQGLKIGQTMSAINCSFIGAKTFINYIDEEEFIELIYSLLDSEIVNFTNTYESKKEIDMKVKEFLLDL